MFRKFTTLFGRRSKACQPEGSPAKSPASNSTRCVGTYHKTGSVWMRRIFEAVASELDVTFSNISPSRAAPPAFGGGNILFHSSSRFPEELFSLPVKGVRIVRDPRDVVVSGAHYHSQGREPWLHTKNDLFGGKSYFEAINALEDIQEKYRFEMRYQAGWVIRQMHGADGNEALHAFIQNNFSTIKYETLVKDVELVEVAKICTQLQVPFDRVAPIFVKGSLFGQQNTDDIHIRSGKSQQWKTEFTQETAEEFASLHQEALIGLGYEIDDSWLKFLGDAKRLG